MKIIVVVNFIRPVYIIITSCFTPSRCADENIGASKMEGREKAPSPVGYLKKKPKLKIIIDIKK
jgi:hypothetical protein